MGGGALMAVSDGSSSLPTSLGSTPSTDGLSLTSAGRLDRLIKADCKGAKVNVDID